MDISVPTKLYIKNLIKDIWDRQIPIKIKKNIIKVEQVLKEGSIAS